MGVGMRRGASGLHGDGPDVYPPSYPSETQGGTAVRSVHAQHPRPWNPPGATGRLNVQGGAGVDAHLERTKTWERWTGRRSCDCTLEALRNSTPRVCLTGRCWCGMHTHCPPKLLE